MHYRQVQYIYRQRFLFHTLWWISVWPYALCKAYTATNMDKSALPSSCQPTIAFASRDDEERYTQLNQQVARHRLALEAIERERASILRRAAWSLDEVMEREG